MSDGDGAPLQGLAAQCVPEIVAYVLVTERTRVWEGVGRREAQAQAMRKLEVKI